MRAIKPLKNTPIKDTRYIIGRREWIFPFYLLEMLLWVFIRFFYWTKPMETKHFQKVSNGDKEGSGAYIIEYCELHCQYKAPGLPSCLKSQKAHEDSALGHSFKGLGNTELLCFDNHKLIPSGHKHFGFDSFYPECEIDVE
tara:strand:+ start:4565 stop:4987 length:423 start_codon:yes stop_codon:yes gene_type:complete